MELANPYCFSWQVVRYRVDSEDATTGLYGNRDPSLYGLADAFIEVNETSCGLRGACDRLRGVRASVLESCQCRKLLRFPLPPNFEVSQVLLLRGAELELEAFPSRVP